MFLFAGVSWCGIEAEPWSRCRNPGSGAGAGAGAGAAVPEPEPEPVGVEPEPYSEPVEK